MVGTGKGLSYLHEECLEGILNVTYSHKIIHLHEHLQQRVADFGLSKLIEKKGLRSNFS